MNLFSVNKRVVDSAQENLPGMKAAGKSQSFIWVSLAFTLFALSLIYGFPVTKASGEPHFLVTNNNDSGPGSLRQAILDMNANNP